MAQPTPKELAAAGLVEVSPTQVVAAHVNGYPAYVSKHWQTPVTPRFRVAYENTSGVVVSTSVEAAGAAFPVAAAPSMPTGQTFISWADGQHTYLPGATYTMPATSVTFVVIYSTTPVPPPVTAPNASGIPIAGPAGANMKLYFSDEFATGYDPTIWTGEYTGNSEGAEQGQFGGASHFSFPGDSTMRLLTFSDPVLSKGLYNNWVGAGTGAWLKPLTVGCEVYVCAKMQQHENVAHIALLIGDGTWGPELDFCEMTPTLSNPNPSSMSGTRLTGPSGQTNNQPQATLPKTDFTQWHVYGVQWGAASITYTIDGVVWARWQNTSVVGDVNGLNGPTKQALCIQSQTGDPGTPQVNASITASNPIEFIVDWAVAYEGA